VMVSDGLGYWSSWRGGCRHDPRRRLAASAADRDRISQWLPS
jgi:hypothetical protein